MTLVIVFVIFYSSSLHVLGFVYLMSYVPSFYPTHNIYREMNNRVFQIPKVTEYALRCTVPNT